MRSGAEVGYQRKVEREFCDRRQRLARTGIPERYWDLTWEQLDPFPAGMEGAVAAVKDFVQEVADAPGREWQQVRTPFLSGPPGIGKTMLANLAGVAVSDLGFCVRYVPWARYVDMLASRPQLTRLMDRDDGTDYADELAAGRRWEDEVRQVAELVIFDDIGKEHRTASGLAGDAFDLVLRHRRDTGLLSLPTTNISLSKWADTYSEPMKSLIFEICRPTPINFGGQRLPDIDYRRKNAPR